MAAAGVTLRVVDPQRAARLLALLALPGVVAGKVYEAFKARQSVEATYAYLASTLPGARERLASLLPGCEAAVERALVAGLQVLTVQDDGYPPVLKDERLPPPPVLFVRGRLPRQLLAPYVNELAAVGVVGTRKASSEGLAEARHLGASLAAAGAVVVSGLALGIDGAAHRGALEARRRDEGAAATVAVLGGAHDRLHPRAHQALAEEIVATGGAVVSEHPPGTPPRPHLFLHRNRLIAALSRVVVVVEAGERSGANSTAQHAVRVGRDVLTVPARPSDRRRAGNLQLLRDGAKVLVDLTDLAAHLSSVTPVAEALRALAEGRTPSGATQARLFPAGSGPPEAAGPPSAGSRAGAPELTPPAGVTRAPPVGYGCLRVLAVLTRDGDASFDGLLARLTRSGLRARPTPAELAGCLVRLELAGRVRRGDDGRYRPA